MKNTYVTLIFTALVGLAVGRIGNRGDEVEQEHGDFIEKPKRELDLAGFGGLRTEDSGGLERDVDPAFYSGDLFNSGLYGGFGPGAENSGGLYREVDPGYSGDLFNSGLYGGFGPGAENSGGLNREVDPGYSGDLFNSGLYGGFGPGAENSDGLNREVGPDDYRVFVACKDDGCMERVKSLGQVHYEYRYIKAIAVTIPLDTLARLNVDADVDFTELDSEIYMSDWPDDPPPPGGYRLPDLSSYGIILAQGDSAAIPSAGKLLQCDDDSALKVAFVDGGAYYFHEDSPCRLSVGNCDGASFGTSDLWYSPDAVWHGTHLLGIVGAVGGNGFGVAGMVPQVDSGVCYLFARVTPESGGAVRWSDALAGVEWSLDKGADVINLSFSSGSDSELARRLLEIAKQQGTINVAGSGNSGALKQEYPSSYPSVISVGSVGQSNNKWSSFASCNNNVDVAGPGEFILSMDQRPLVSLDFPDYGPYSFQSGTSMAAAFVTGAIAKIWSVCEACTNLDVESCITSSTKALSGVPVWCALPTNVGLVQAEEAYSCLVNTCC